MLQEFLTIDETAERLKDRGYDDETVQAVVAKGGCPFHVRDMVILIPFPEADESFPPLPPKPTPPDETDAAPAGPPDTATADAPAPDPAEDDKPKKAGGRRASTKNPA